MFLQFPSLYTDCHDRPLALGRYGQVKSFSSIDSTRTVVKIFDSLRTDARRKSQTLTPMSWVRPLKELYHLMLLRDSPYICKVGIVFVSDSHVECLCVPASDLRSVYLIQILTRGRSPGHGICRFARGWSKGNGAKSRGTAAHDTR